MAQVAGSGPPGTPGVSGPVGTTTGTSGGGGVIAGGGMTTPPPGSGVIAGKMPPGVPPDGVSATGNPGIADFGGAKMLYNGADEAGGAGGAATTPASGEIGRRIFGKARSCTGGSFAFRLTSAPPTRSPGDRRLKSPATLLAPSPSF